MSIQQRFFPELNCFGCGPANPQGLHLSSYPAEVGTVAQFTPRPEHDNGLGFLNGGIICTVLDCHSATPVLLEVERLGLARDDGPLPYVTAGLQVAYLRPTPLTGACQLRARTVDIDNGAMQVAVELWAEGKLRVEGQASWKRWRARETS